MTRAEQAHMCNECNGQAQIASCTGCFCQKPVREELKECCVPNFHFERASCIYLQAARRRDTSWQLIKHELYGWALVRREAVTHMSQHAALPSHPWILVFARDATSNLLLQEAGPGADGAGPLALVAVGFVLLLPSNVVKCFCACRHSFFAYIDYRHRCASPATCSSSQSLSGQSRTP